MTVRRFWWRITTPSIRILNRVHPEDGRAASTSKDHLKLSKWAEAYERDHGGIRCHARANHNARRRQGLFIKNTNLTREEYDWVKQHRSLSPEDIRTARADKQVKDHAELKAAFLRRQTALERQLRRDYALPQAKLEREIQSIEARIGKTGFFRAVVRKLTGAEKRDHANLTKLKASLQAFEDRSQERRDALKAEYARDWERMERTHHAERARDEALIERKRTEGERSRAGEIARKSFRVRAGSDTARHAPTASERQKAKSDYEKAAPKPEKPDSQSDRQQAMKEAKERVRKRSESSKSGAERARRRRSRPRNKGRDYERD